MKTILLILVSSFISISIYAQNKLGNEWITGGGGNRVKFTQSGIFTSDNKFILSYFTKGNSNICDTNGNLILCSDGYNVYDSNANYLDGGDTLIPKDLFVDQDGWSALSQSSIFLPMDSGIYYFITPTMSDSQYADCQANSNCHFDLLLYNIIDMKANGGAGKVVKRMQPLMEHAFLSKTRMMACRHANGKDWWLLKQSEFGNVVFKFLFTQDSIYDYGSQVFNSPSWGSGWDLRGQSMFSQDGSKYATTVDGIPATGEVFIADFDRCYGILSNEKIIYTPELNYHNPNDTTQKQKTSVGLAFSPNGKLLYVMSPHNLLQYDLDDNTWFHVAGLDTSYQKFQDYSSSYLGPDNKLYIGNFGGTSKQMSVVNNPDVKGAGCNFCPRCLRLDSLGANAYVGTPPCMPNYGLGAQVCWPLESSEIGDKRLETLEVYPNPSSTYIDVRYEIRDNRNATIELFTALGQRVYTSPISHLKSPFSIDVSNLSTGIYYLRVENLVKKVIIE
ncbi:MAG: T9SS type A sorting domain-containing protein [Bacteroidetes bacterium]|nr:T9SS type A sorting domain-containing protein [Bacteroidota bacterium]